MDHNELWKVLKETGIPDHLTCLLRNLYEARKQQLEMNMEQQTVSTLGKEYIEAVYCHPAYLTYNIFVKISANEYLYVWLRGYTNVYNYNKAI